MEKRFDKRSFVKGLLVGIGACLLVFLICVFAIGCQPREDANLQTSTSKVVRSLKFADKEDVDKVLDLGETKNGTRSTGTSLSHGWYYSRASHPLSFISKTQSVTTSGVVKRISTNVEYTFSSYHVGTEFTQFYFGISTNDDYLYINRYFQFELKVNGVATSGSFGAGVFELYFDYDNGNDVAMNGVRRFFSVYEDVDSYDISLSLSNCVFQSGLFVDIPVHGSFNNLSFVASTGYTFSVYGWNSAGLSYQADVSVTGSGSSIGRYFQLGASGPFSLSVTAYSSGFSTQGHDVRLVGGSYFDKGGIQVNGSASFYFEKTNPYYVWGVPTATNANVLYHYETDDGQYYVALNGVQPGCSLLFSANPVNLVLDMHLQQVSLVDPGDYDPDVVLGETYTYSFLCDDPEYDIGSLEVFDYQDVDIQSVTRGTSVSSVTLQVIGRNPEIYVRCQKFISGLDIVSNGSWSFEGGTPAQYRYFTEYTITFTPLGIGDSFENVTPLVGGMNVIGNTDYWNGTGTFVFSIVSPQPWIRYDATPKTPIATYTFPDFYSPVSMFGTDTQYDGSVVYADLMTGYENYIVLKGLLFQSQGVWYNRIKISLVWVGDGTAGVLRGEDTLALSGKVWIVGSVWYGYTDDGTLGWGDALDYKYQAGRVDSEGYSNIAGSGTLYRPGIRWVNYSASQILVYDVSGPQGTRVNDIGSPEHIGENMSDWEFLQNYSKGAVAPGYQVSLGFGSNYDPFVLIANAMNTVVGFMNFAVLPGLTIGILWVIPMLIVLVIVFIKLIKK